MLGLPGRLQLFASSTASEERITELSPLRKDPVGVEVVG